MCMNKCLLWVRARKSQMQIVNHHKFIEIPLFTQHLFWALLQQLHIHNEQGTIPSEVLLLFWIYFSHVIPNHVVSLGFVDMLSSRAWETESGFVLETLQRQSSFHCPTSSIQTRKNEQHFLTFKYPIRLFLTIIFAPRLYPPPHNFNITCMWVFCQSFSSSLVSPAFMCLRCI